MEKTEAPTPERLLALREQGRIATSEFANRCVGLSGLLIGIYLSRDAWLQLRLAWGGAIRDHKLPSGVDLLTNHNLAQSVGTILLLPVVTAAVGAVFFGLLSNRFLLIGPLIAWQRGGDVRQAGVLAYLFQIIAAWLLLIAGVWMLFPLALGVLLRAHENADGFFSLWGRMLTMLCAPALLGLALVAQLLARILFLHRHRMSRREIESELSEEQ